LRSYLEKQVGIVRSLTLATEFVVSYAARFYQRKQTIISPQPLVTFSLARVIISILKMEATLFSETSVYDKPTRRHISEDGILQHGFLLKTHMRM
jgi:hypothetical protein